MESWNELLAFLPDFLLKTSIAVVCGGLIGIERERRGKPAGFRTNILICLGATIYMLLSKYIARRMGAANIDHTRIAAQMVTGIGFLGAGTIIQSRGTVVGLTSAAIIWVAAGIGLLIGTGYPIVDDGGKTKARVMEVLVDQELTRTSYELLHEETFFRLKTRYCDKHAAHARFINEIMGLAGVIEMRAHDRPHS